MPINLVDPIFSQNQQHSKTVQLQSDPFVPQNQRLLDIQTPQLWSTEAHASTRDIIQNSNVVAPSCQLNFSHYLIEPTVATSYHLNISKPLTKKIDLCHTTNTK